MYHCTYTSTFKHIYSEKKRKKEKANAIERNKRRMCKKGFLYFHCTFMPCVALTELSGLWEKL